MKLQRTLGLAMASIVGAAASVIGIQATGASAASIVNWTANGTSPFTYSIAIDSAGNLYTSNYNANTVTKITPVGVTSTLGTTGSQPIGIAVDSSGNVYTANNGSNNVSKILPDGTSSILGTTGVQPFAIAVDSTGNVYTSNSSDSNVSKILPDGTSSILGSTGSTPRAIALDSTGNVYTANALANNVSKILANGTSSILASTGSFPYGIAIDAADTVYTANYNGNSVTKILQDGTASTLGTTGANPRGIVLDGVGNVYTVNNSDESVTKITPGGVSTTLGTTGPDPRAITTDLNGNFYTANSGSSNVSLLWQSAPTITGVAPSTGSPSGGTAITITGTDFVTGATVTVGGAACTSVVVVSATSITCTTPAGTEGSADVVVTNADTGTDTEVGGFTYAISTPTITDVSPAAGATFGGTPITITGTDFYPNAAVTVGGNACTPVVVVSPTSITCTTPAGALGAADVVVTNTDTGSATDEGGFAYQTSSPSITNVSPTAGPLSGGTAITITGTAFYPGAIVSVGGAACTEVTVVSTTEITCKTPASVAGAVAVVVTNTDTGAATKTNAFTYQDTQTKPAPPRALKMTGGPTSKKFVFKWKAPKVAPKTGYLVTIHQRGKPSALLSQQQDTKELTFTITRKTLLKLATKQSRGDMGNINFVFRVRALNDQQASTATIKRFLVRI